MKFDYLINKLKEKIFPYTHIDAVLSDDENKNLHDILTDIDSKFDQIQQTTQPDWNEPNEESASYIKNKPSSLPSNGGNADTVDNKHASDFANATDLEIHTRSDTSHLPVDGVIGQILSVGNSGIREWIDLPDIPTNTFSGSYNDLTDKPLFGTVSAKNIAASGNASDSQVVMGNDTRLTDSRNASDVYDWAKEATKPTYIKSEIGLGDVDNTPDNIKNVLSANKLTTPRTINGVPFDGTLNITVPTTPAGYKTITYSTTEPTTVGVDEIVFVYE